MSVVKRPRSLVDLDEIAAHLMEHAGEEIAIRFLDAAEELLVRIASMPASGALFECEDPRLRGLRHASIHGFRNHYLFYLESPSGIELVRVLHAKRDLNTRLMD